VEILHVFSLGVIKYMMRDFMQSLTTKKLDEMYHWWAAVNLNGLNIPDSNHQSQLHNQSLQKPCW
jgi:hypothetical protein